MLTSTQLRELVEREWRASGVPGLAVAIIEGDEIAYAEGLGVTSVEDGGVPVTPETLFRIGSITKPLTGTAIMRLVEVGELDLDSPVRDYLPWLRLSGPAATDVVTLRMLMTHTSGLPIDDHPFGRHDPEALEAFVRDQIPCLPLVAPPGKTYSYSNPALSVVGCVAEAATGKHYGEAMHELVFDPLGMTRTTFDSLVAMTYPLAQDHRKGPDGDLHVMHQFADNAAFHPAGYAMSTVLDLANFAIMQMDHGRFRGQQILSPASVDEMHRVHTSVPPWTTTGYGLTFFIDEAYRGVRLVMHNGGMLGFGGSLHLVPEKRVGVVTLFNYAFANTKPYRIAPELLDRLLGLSGGAPKVTPISPGRQRWPSYAGAYLGHTCGLAVIRAHADRLVMALNGREWTLRAYQADTYFGERQDGGGRRNVRFLCDGADPVQHISIDGSVAERIDLDPGSVPDPEHWQAFIGTYERPGVDTLTLTIEDDQLVGQYDWSDEKMPCVPLSSRRFAFDAGFFELNASEDGTLPSLKLGYSTIYRRVS